MAKMEPGKRQKGYNLGSILKEDLYGTYSKKKKV